MKTATFLYLIFLLLMLSSCQPAPPFGIWKSEYPNIVIYINQDYRIIGGFPAIYTLNGEEIKVTAMPHRNYLTIRTLDDRTQLFGGGFRETRNTLRWTINFVYEDFGERTSVDYTTIVFQRLDHYDPIDPEDLVVVIPPPPFELPQELIGTWKSHDPKLIMNLYQDEGSYQDSFLVHYIVNEQEMPALVMFFRTSSMQANIVAPDMGYLEFLAGYFQRVGEQLHFIISPHFGDGLDFDTIIFDRIDNAENHDPTADYENDNSYLEEYTLEDME